MDNQRQKQRRKVCGHKHGARRCNGPKHFQKQTDQFFHLKYIVEGWQEEGLQIMVACNRKSAVDWLNSRKPIKPMEVHYDLLAAIQEL